MVEEKAENEEENEEDTSIWRIVETSSPPILSLFVLVDSLNKISTSFTLRSFTLSIYIYIDNNDCSDEDKENDDEVEENHLKSLQQLIV